MDKRRVYVIVNDNDQTLTTADGDPVIFDSYMEAVQFCLVHSFTLMGCKVVEVND